MVKISSCLFFGMTLEARKLFQSLLEACLWELDSIHINPYCNSLSSWLRPDALHNKGSLPNKSVLLLDIDPAPPLHAPSLSTPIPHSPQWTTRLQKSLFIFKNLLQGFKFHKFNFVLKICCLVVTPGSETNKTNSLQQLKLPFWMLVMQQGPERLQPWPSKCNNTGYIYRAGLQISNFQSYSQWNTVLTDRSALPPAAWQGHSPNLTYCKLDRLHSLIGIFPMDNGHEG